MPFHILKDQKGFFFSQVRVSLLVSLIVGFSNPPASASKVAETMGMYHYDLVSKGSTF